LSRRYCLISSVELKWFCKFVECGFDFRLNEEMIETLFMVNNPNFNVKDHNGRRQSLPLLNQENRVLDPKKSQNIAILLRALNVTIEEVCDALLEGEIRNIEKPFLDCLKLSLQCIANLLMHVLPVALESVLLLNACFITVNNVCFL